MPYILSCRQYDQSTVKDQSRMAKTSSIMSSSWETPCIFLYILFNRQHSTIPPNLIRLKVLLYIIFSFSSSCPLPPAPFLLLLPLSVLQRLLCGLRRCLSQWRWLKATRWSCPATPHQACLLHSPSGWTAVSTSYIQIYTHTHRVYFPFCVWWNPSKIQTFLSGCYFLFSVTAITV